MKRLAVVLLCLTASAFAEPPCPTWTMEPNGPCCETSTPWVLSGCGEACFITVPTVTGPKWLPECIYYEPGGTWIGCSVVEVTQGLESRSCAEPQDCSTCQTLTRTTHKWCRAGEKVWSVVTTHACTGGCNVPACE